MNAPDDSKSPRGDVLDTAPPLSDQPPLSEQQQDFYRTMRQRIQKFLAGKGKTFKYADYLLVAPDMFHLMCKLALDKRVSIKSKAMLAGGIAYFVSPLDMIPEGIVGPIGYVDDLAVAALVLSAVINDGAGDAAREHWAGDGDLLGHIQEILRVADEMVGSGMWGRLKGMFPPVGRRR